MQKTLKTYIGTSALVLSLVAVMPFAALAHNNSNDEDNRGNDRNHDSVAIRPQVDVRQTVQINPNGDVTLKGAVGSVGSTSLVVKSWGGDWTVNVASGAKLNSRANAVIALTDIKAGDVVMVHGVMKAGAGLSIDARQVKDQFIPDRSVAVRGTIASIGANTLTVKSGDATWTVNTTSATKFTSKFDIATTLAAMKVGDDVTVKGAVVAGSTTTVNATDVKDASLPLNAVSRVGTITSMVGNAFTLATKQRNGQDVKVTTDSSTMYVVNGKAGTSADLKNDSKVTVQGVLNTDTGVLSAVKVMINDVKIHWDNSDKKDDHKGGRK